MDLKHVDIFKNLSDSELKMITDLARISRVNAGIALIQESERGEAIFLIKSGRVDVKVSVPGSDQLESIAQINEGEVVGELMLVGKTRRSAFVYAKDEVEVLIWSKSDLIQLFEKNNHIGYRVMANIASLVADRLTSTNMVLRNIMSVPKSTIF